MKTAHHQESKESKLVNRLRAAANKEQAIRLNASYIKPVIHAWWHEYQNKHEVNAEAKVADEPKQQLKRLLQSTFCHGEIALLRQVGSNDHHLSAVCLYGLFDIENRTLAAYVHDALSELSGLQDIQYAYENHRWISIVDRGNATDWSGNSNQIRFHSDDIYESKKVDLLALTTVKDDFAVPILCISAKSILNQLNDNEVLQLANMKALFISGKNVQVRKEMHKPILSINGARVQLALDFRQDSITSARMRAGNKHDKVLLDKVRQICRDITPVETIPRTGVYSLFANRAVLHGRNEITNAAKNSTLNRTLIRSKGPYLPVMTAPTSTALRSAL